MSKAKLKPEILKKLVERTGLKKESIRVDLSRLKNKYPKCTLNAVAQLYARSRGFSVMQKLSEEDKNTLPNHDVEKSVVKLKEKKAKPKEKIIELINYETNDHFQKGHIDEINKAYTKGCYTSAYILSRKVIENLILDILRTKFPSTKLDNKELYYDINRRRYKDFEIFLKNLYDKRHEFNINNIKPIERLYEKAKNFKDRANDTTHSWYYLIKTKKELDDLEIQEIINLIKVINIEIYNNLENV